MRVLDLLVNGEHLDVTTYMRLHHRRIARSLAALHTIGARRIVELGGHPWVMSSALLDDGAFELAATISAEEITHWPDDIGVTRREYHMCTLGGREVSFPNYSANVERTRFSIDEQPDTVLACEIIEHLVRAPHIMLLNINQWLPVGGKLVISTPNGAQFSNPLRRHRARPAYRCNVYARHNGAFTRAQLVDLVQLCGFKIHSAGFWNVYERSGPSRLYSMLSALPFEYCQEKFQRTLVVTAEKAHQVTALARLPQCYAPSQYWEYVQHTKYDHRH
jgi:hypothetical protein